MFKDLLVTFFFKKQTVCLFFYFVSLTWGDISDKILLRAMSEILLPMCSSRIFMVLGLTFKSLIHFEFILYVA